MVMKIIQCMGFMFKVGFKGKFVEFVGMLDYVFKPFVYLL